MLDATIFNLLLILFYNFYNTINEVQVDVQ